MKIRTPDKRVCRKLLQQAVLAGSLLSAILASTFTFGLPIPSASAQAAALVSVDPPSTTGLLPGDVFAVNIMITGVTDLKSWQFHISFRGLLDNVLSVSEVIEGDFLMIGGTTYLATNIDNLGGHVQAAAVILGQVPGVSGDGWLATVVFEVIGGGQSPLDLHDTILLDSNSAEIAHDLAGGYYVGRVPHAVFTYSPVAPAPGEAVIFNASGSYDPDGVIAIYSWNFGDNTGSSGPAPGATHVYSNPDMYLVALTVTDNDGFNETATLLLSISQQPPPPATEIFVSPPRIEDPTIVPGEAFSIEIRIAEVFDLYAWEFRLSWRATLLDPLNVTEGSFLAGLEEAPTYFVYTIYEDQNGTDSIVVACTRLGAALGVSGSGILATITFRVEGIDETTLGLYDTRLRDSVPNPIDHIPTDGYFSNSGTPPPTPTGYTRSYLPSQWISDGAAMGWHTDDGSWAYTLPFDFPFYGAYYRTIYISSNGLITFNGPDSSFSNSISGLASKLAIAPAWEDWETYNAPYDLYIGQPDSNHVMIRWYVRRLGTSINANFETLLDRNGVIQFNYGSNDGPISATAGISNGFDNILAEDLAYLNYINSVLFIPYEPEHELEAVLDVPSTVAYGQTTTINATARNIGLSNETNVVLQLLIDGLIVDSAVIPELPSSSAYALSYSWTPSVEGYYNITAYVPPIFNETLTSNNLVTRIVSVARPLIQPTEGHFASYLITSPYGQGILFNTTYSRYLTPTQMHVDVSWRDLQGNYTWADWLTLNTITRQVEQGMWSGYWYPMWLEPNVTLNSTVRILNTAGWVTGSRFIEIGDYLVDCWELYVPYYDGSYAFWFDKVNGLVTAVKGTFPYGSEDWRLLATNVPLIYLPRLRIQANPTIGFVDTQVEVTGAHATPNALVEIYWDNALMGTTPADESGNFGLVLTVPRSIRGPHMIRAMDLSTGVSDTAEFTVVPSVLIAPESGPIGTKVAIQGLGFDAHTSLMITFDDALMSVSMITDETGSFTATINVPVAAPGAHAIKAVGYPWYNSTQATFVVVDTETLAVIIDAGTIFFKGETAEFYVQTSLHGRPIDATSMNIILYDPSGATRTLTAQKIATGFYRVRYAITGKGSVTGTYTIAVEAAYASDTAQAYGTSIKTLLVKPTWERDAPRIAALSIASIGLIGGMLVLWKREKKRYL